MTADERGPVLTDAGEPAQFMPLDVLMATWRPGSGDWTWVEEADRLWSEQPQQMDELASSIMDAGVRHPVLVAHDGRVWDGHHRICVAHRLALPAIPFDFAYSTPASVVDELDALRALLREARPRPQVTNYEIDLAARIDAALSATPAEDGETGSEYEPPFEDDLVMPLRYEVLARYNGMYGQTAQTWPPAIVEGMAQLQAEFNAWGAARRARLDAKEGTS